MKNNNINKRMMKRREMLRASTTGKAFLKTLLKIMVKKNRIIAEKDKELEWKKSVVEDLKKLLKPGRGSKNVRFSDKTKAECQRIWESEHYRNAAKYHATDKRKITHADVFKVAKGELAKLSPPILNAADFSRVLGAVSDKKHRESHALRKKRDKTRQAVYSPISIS